ncbi:MAG: cell division protein FtsA [Bacteroidales bacterium]|nr:cell division protein FtsA [Bacteroidales bacterium]
MEITDRHIVAIDLGTYKLAVTVAKVTGMDVQIIYYKESPSAGIRYSSVFHVTQAAEVLSRAVREAEEALGIKISQAVVGMPKYPVRQESNTAKVEDRGFDADITAEDIAELKNFAQNTYPLQNPEKEAIYGAVAQSFSDGENFQIIENDIIGMTSDVLDGNFKIFIGKKSDLSKIDTAMNKAGIVVSRKFFTADSTAKAVLTDSEMENGVALIDFGAGSTSVSIYHGNIMRHYASIPFGGKSITDDIKSECLVSERLAENIKLAFGACMPEKLQNLSEKVIHIRSNSTEPDSQLPVKYLSEIITARIEEIMMAVLYEIQESGFADMLRSGIVVTGGCAQTANLNSFLFELSGYKVRTGYPKMLFSGQNCDGINDTTAAPSIGLIFACMDEEINCCRIQEEAADESDSGTIFSDKELKDMEVPEETVAETVEAPKKTENTDKKKKKEKGGRPKWIQGIIKWSEDLAKDIEQDKV